MISHVVHACLCISMQCMACTAAHLHLTQHCWVTQLFWMTLAPFDLATYMATSNHCKTGLIIVCTLHFAASGLIILCTLRFAASLQVGVCMWSKHDLRSVGLATLFS